MTRRSELILGNPNERRRILRHRPAAVFFGLALFSQAVYAEDICRVALESNAFNTRDTSRSVRIAFERKEDICQRDYASSEDFRNSARSGGFNVSYQGVGLGQSGGRSAASGQKSFREEAFCQASQEDLGREYSMNEIVQVGDVALAAWRDCIAITRANSLWLEYQVQEDGSGLTGVIRRTIRDGTTTLRITSMQVQPDTKENLVSCQVAGRRFTAQSLVQEGPIVTGTTREIMSCTKPAEETVRVALATDGGSLLWVTLPSAAQRRVSDMEELASRLERLDAEVQRQTLRAAEIESSIVPRGAVAFFALNTCPSGWTQYSELAGRMIVGRRPSWEVGQQLGANEVTVSREALPRIQLRLPTRGGDGNNGPEAASDYVPGGHPWAVAATERGNYNVWHQRHTEYLGMGQPLRLPLPQSLALTPCRKN